jgi:SAM-dependent methyltransferase
MTYKTTITALIRRFVRLNHRASAAVEKLLPRRPRTDGNMHYLKTLPDLAAVPDGRVYDVGGGSLPGVPVTTKQAFNLHYIGLDISAEELSAAPPGRYDETIVADICGFEGREDGDVVIVQSALEHVQDTEQAIASVASVVAPGGQVHIFVPCRNALFARLNLLLPQAFKARLLRILSSDTAEHQGFPAYYDRCTPRDLSELLEQHDLEVRSLQYFWSSKYFFYFFPAYLLWRSWQPVAWLLLGRNACETFVVSVMRRSWRAHDRRPAPCPEGSFT